MIKMFASDLDGTLLNALHEADGAIRRAIRELTEAGLHVVPATGRSTLPGGEHGFTGLTLDACCSNGSIVRDSHGEVLKTWTIDPQVTEELLKAFPDICFDCSTPDGMFSSGSFEMHQAGFKKDSPIKRIVMRGMRARGGYHEEQYFDQSIGDILRHDVCKINCRVTSPDLERDLKAYLAERSDRVVNAPFDPVMFEITDVACNKGESVAWLAGYNGIVHIDMTVEYPMQAMAAVSIGVTLSAGGAGSFVGSVTGVVVLTMLNSVLLAFNMAAGARTFIQGLVLLLVLIINNRSAKLRQ